MSTYQPRGMPARFMVDAPASVRKAIIDIIAIVPAAPLDFDVVFRDVDQGQMFGLDFDRDGAQGCHFFLKTYEMRAYRERNRRKRVAWRDLPDATQKAIIRYVENDD